MNDVQPHYSHQLRVLELLSSAGRYNDWIASLALPHLGKHPLEIGSGLGDQAERWLRAGVPRITASELEPRALHALRARFDRDSRVDVRELDVNYSASGSYTAVVAVNVLEHISDDARSLANIRQLVRPNGRVVVFVPACPLAMSRFDREIGHFRRYTKRMLTDRFRGADLEPVDVRYVNAPGLIAWFAWMKCLRGRPSNGALLQLWDKLVVPAARALESRVEAPFGQSVLGVGQPI